MKKILILSSIVSLLILGCGSDGDSDNDSGDKKSIDAALKIGDVAYSTPAGIDFGNKMSTSLNKMQKTIYKKSSLNIAKTTEYCSETGTMSYDESDTTVTVAFDKCINLNNETYTYEYYNGSLSVNESENQTSIIAQQYTYVPNTYYPNTGTYMNLSIETRENGDISEIEIDGEMKEFDNNYILEDMNFDKLTIKENSSNSAIYIGGGYSYKAGCLDESHRYNTTEWLIPSSTDDDIISGTIIVDNKTYIYNSPNVTVKVDDREGTFNQSELRAETVSKKNSNECTSSTMKLQ
ncbi:hypothetical protein GSY74_03745 [Sulfurovum sp. bin170]|uniref:hypothetical protein n=1 Tax=Sulfurovum sp. bin170 TaxID=2695268 RepID=UPI0013DFB08C|nr:hypothetical protein [Sulfurovum sp. bin170]NEW60385.1 hypothetical protein [Sulfurovum sp. bin170]